MNQSSTPKHHEHKSSKTTLPNPNKNNKMQKRNYKKPHQKKPFQDLSNGYFPITNNNNINKDGNFDNKSINANTSIEAPKGCLRFFLSNSSSSSSKTSFNSVSSNSTSYCSEKIKSFSLKTPNSAPSFRPSKENLSKRGFFNKPSSQKAEKVKKIQSWRKPSLRNVESFELVNSSGSSVNKRELGFGECGVENLTPLSKVNKGLCLNFVDDDEMKVDLSSNDRGISSGNTRTPPVQASVSPEIQCGSSMLSLTAKTVTPACYGAGHVVSGVTDKRKCRARGTLTVGEAKALDCFDSDDSVEMDNGVVGVVEDSDLAVLPLPAEASMHWLLSPCNEEDEDEDEKENSEIGLDCIQSLEECPIFNSPASVSSGSIGFSPNLCKSSNDGSSRRRRKSGPMLSPCELQGKPPLYDKLSVPCSETEKKKCDTNADKSPMSLGSQDSRNLIQTPQSDMSSERQIGMSWLFAEDNRQKQNFDSELSDVADSLHMASLLSQRSHVSIWDPTSSSFQFDCLTTPSNSVDFSRFEKVLDDRASWFSNSTFENVSQSQMRISWRDGLVSRIFEMDEYDSCRYLSDEEDDVKECENDGLKSHEGLELNVNNAGDCNSIEPMESKEFVDRENNIDERANNGLHPGPQLPYSCAESISTDGGDLIRSEDSDWTICYKNHLFQV